MVGLGALAVGLIAALVWALSPRPGALLIRGLFESEAGTTVEEMQWHATDIPITANIDEVYGDSGEKTSLDVFSPSGTSGPLTTVAWVRGGAWISGDKATITH